MKNRLDNLKNNSEFQKKMERLKPKRSIWGILGVVLFFFVPEIVNVLWHKEITTWLIEIIENAPKTPVSELLEWSIPKIFTGEISFFNIGLGIAFLVWIFWNDIKRWRGR